MLAAIEKAKQAKDGHDLDALKQAVNNLHTVAHALAQHRGGGAGPGPDRAGPPPPQSGSGGAGSGDVIDAEFEEKK